MDGTWHLFLLFTILPRGALASLNPPTDMRDISYVCHLSRYIYQKTEGLKLERSHLDSSSYLCFRNASEGTCLRESSNGLQKN